MALTKNTHDVVRTCALSGTTHELRRSRFPIFVLFFIDESPLNNQQEALRGPSSPLSLSFSFSLSLSLSLFSGLSLIGHVVENSLSVL